MINKNYLTPPNLLHWFVLILVQMTRKLLSHFNLSDISHLVSWQKNRRENTTDNNHSWTTNVNDSSTDSSTCLTFPTTTNNNGSSKNCAIWRSNNRRKCHNNSANMRDKRNLRNNNNYHIHKNHQQQGGKNHHQPHIKEINKNQKGKKSVSKGVIYLCVTVTAVICYLNSIGGDFVHDDLSAIKSNNDVIGDGSIWDLFHNDFWGKPMSDRASHKSYRPLTILTFRLNVLLHDLSPAGFHWVNVLLHGLVSALFVHMILEVARSTRQTALIAGLHFAVHPVHTEAVAGVVGRADILAALFSILSFIAYYRCLRSGLGKYFFLSILLGFGAGLSKEHGITVLGISTLFDTYVHKRLLINFYYMREMNTKLKDFIKRNVAVVVSGLVFMIFRIIMVQGSLPQFSDQDNPASFSLCRSTRLRTFSYLPAFNFWLLLAPISLNYDWQMGSIPMIKSWRDTRNLFYLIFYIFLLFSAFLTFFRKGRFRREALVGLIFLVIPFVPASNLLFRVGFVVAERILYISSLGFSLLVGSGAQRLLDLAHSNGGGGKIFWRHQKNLIRGFLVGLLVLFALKTGTRNLDWRSRDSLFTSGLQSLPHNAKMHYNYANLQKDLGNAELAIQHYKNALRLWPRHASAHNNLGTMLNDSREAEYHFQQALLLNPHHAHALFNLANLKHKQGQTLLGIKLMKRSLEHEPNNPDALTNLATMEADLGHFHKAEEIHLRVLQLEPNKANHLNNYAAFLQRIGKFESALKFYKDALDKDENHIVALLNAARLMKKLKQNEEAEALYQRALQLKGDVQTRQASAYGLGVLYLNMRRFLEAEALLTEALSLKPNDTNVKVQLAQIHVQQKKYKEAELILLEVVEQSYRGALDLKSKPTSKDNYCPGPVKKPPFLSSSIVTHLHLNLGAIYHVKGLFEEAWRHYHLALAHSPRNEVLLQNMEKLKKAENQFRNASCPHYNKYLENNRKIEFYNYN